MVPARVIVLLLALTATASAQRSAKQCPGEAFDYSDALHKSLLFYEAQRSGPLPADHRVEWRDHSALEDQGDNGEDLTGGYYDAGDFVKFGFPGAFAMTLLAWGGIDYAEGYELAGQADYLRQAVKWGADYYLKCLVSPEEFYGQVGDGHVDHAYWGRPEEMTMERPAFKITPDLPGSELAAETAAALAAASILFREENPGYADQLVSAAMDLYALADDYRGHYHDSITNVQDFYRSWSGYTDELVWGAAWLYWATGDDAYLQKAETYYEEYDVNGLAFEFSWDDKATGAQVLLSRLSSAPDVYRSDLRNFCRYAREDVPRSPLGQVFFSEWGSLQYAANAAFICLQTSQLGLDTAANREFAEEQIHYILGSTGRSFVVGFGENPPLRPHHASSSCPDLPAECSWDDYDSPDANPQVLYGAMVGGPAAADDYYVDNREDYIMNEVTIYYNAGFQGLLAAMKELACSNKDVGN